jgi:hypothetical protein
VQAKLIARRGDIAGALSVIDRAERLAMTTEAPMLKGDGSLALAEVLHLSGDDDGALAAIGRAMEHYEEKGATAFVANARQLAAAWSQ